MNYSIVFSTRTGNTRQLADTVRRALPEDKCLYCGGPHPEALRADRIYVGFWTDRGSCDGETARFLQTLTDQEVFLFGSAGFGGSQAYFDQILDRTRKQLAPGVTVTGSWMCQGRMPQSVRQRYEAMSSQPEHPANLEELMANFDRALTHPDQGDLEDLTRAVRASLEP